jgi:deazaflavin-dependent oxidoreductase (nitroreductase family)
MPLPERLARINRRVVNPVVRPFAGRLPPFAIVVHRGRSSGRVYRTPVWSFGAGRGIVVALTYGAKADWVQNVLAQGGCEIIRRGRRVALDHPRLVGNTEGMVLMPGLIRPAVRMIGVTEFLLLDPVDLGQRSRDG